MKKDKIRLTSELGEHRHMAVRRSGDEMTVGVLQPMREGQPLPPECELVQVDTESGDVDGWFDSETLFKNTSGLPQVATPKYREGYDRILENRKWGSRERSIEPRSRRSLGLPSSSVSSPRPTSPSGRYALAEEEALELAQAVGVGRRDQLHRLVDYVFSRPAGKPAQEIAGSMVTLYAAASALGIDADEAFYAELSRIQRPEVIERVDGDGSREARGAQMKKIPSADRSPQVLTREPGHG